MTKDLPIYLINHLIIGIFISKQIPALLKLKSYKSVYSLVSEYISDENLRRVFSMHPLFSWRKSVYHYFNIHFDFILGKKWGIHYAMGGTGKVVAALEKLMQESKIDIIKNAEVTDIVTENSNVKGVKVNNNFIECDYLVNSDPLNVYKNLIKSVKTIILYLNKKLSRMDYSMGLFVYYFCLKEKV